MYKLAIYCLIIGVVTLAAPPTLKKPTQINGGLSSLVPVLPPPAVPKISRELEDQQNRAAHYKFATNVDDHISDLTQQRDEVRDGLTVMGSYSYSDGYQKRTVHYIADERGYRVLKEDVVPLSDGPKVDLNGHASVEAAAHGTHYAYTVHSVPVAGPVPKILDEASFI